MKLVIPTRLRERLPDEFAYPIWPTKITEFLEDTPQRNDAELLFHWRDEFWESHWRKRILQRGIITLVKAEYTPDWSPYFPKWKINVYSVPKEYITPAQEILLDGAMDALAAVLRLEGVTPDHRVKEKITMDLSEWEHDESRLSPEQLASQPQDAAGSGG